jgi:hypothetical protein
MSDRREIPESDKIMGIKGILLSRIKEIAEIKEMLGIKETMVVKEMLGIKEMTKVKANDSRTF